MPLHSLPESFFNDALREALHAKATAVMQMSRNILLKYYFITAQYTMSDALYAFVETMYI